MLTFRAVVSAFMEHRFREIISIVNNRMLAARAWKYTASAWLLSLPHSSKPGVTFFSALARWEREHGLEGGQENSERIEEGRVGRRARHIRESPRHVQCGCSQIPAASE